MSEEVSEEINKEVTFDRVFRDLKAVKGINLHFIVPSKSKSKRYRVTRKNKTLFYLIPLKDRGIAIKGKKKDEELAHRHKIEKSEDLEPWYDYAKKKELRR